MKRLIETIKNIFKIEELRKRILFTLSLILVYRFGSFVVIPGINPEALTDLQSQVSGNGLLGLLNIFSGGAFSNASIFALGIMPYISASIVIQLLGIVVPYFQKLQKEGESGRRKINQWTRYLTIIVLLLQAPAYLANLHGTLQPYAFVLGPSSVLFTVSATIVLIAGTMFVMWLGEKITDKGIGNGVSLIIMVGIIARLPHALMAELNTRFTEATGGLVMLVVELVLLFLVFFGTTRAWGWDLSGETASIIVFVLWGTAEMSDLVRGALISIPKHQYESSEALGLTKGQTYLYIIIPQTVRRLIPLSINLITRMIKTTSLVLMIGVVEVLKVAQQIIEANRMSSPNAAFGIYLVVFLLYFLACWPISLLASYLEKKWR